MFNGQTTPRAPGRTGQRIAFFVPSLRGGGAETVMATVASGLRRRGWEVDMVAASAEGPVVGRLDPNVNVVDLHRAKIRSALPPLVRYLRRRAPRVLISTLSHANILAVLAGRISRTGTAVLVRQANPASDDPWAPCNGPVGRLLCASHRLAYRMSDGVIAVSSGVARDLHSFLRLPQSQITTIYNPVDIESAKRLGAAQPEHPWFDLEGMEGIPLVLAVGRLTPAKDFSTLIRAFRRIADTRPARLVILGEGPERPALEALVRELGLTGAVSLPGYADNPYAYMSRASVFALSSKIEGMPNALIEALALGTPVVSTDCRSGPAEVLDHGKYGRLVPVGDPDALARAIAATLEAPPAPGPQLEFARQRFSLEVCVGEYEQAVLAALSGGWQQGRSHPELENGG